MKKISLIVSMFVFFCGTSVSAGQIRNRYEVVSGAITRAGTTNKKEFNDETLRELCEEGYRVAIFLYKGARSRTVQCSGGRSIEYRSVKRFQDLDLILGKIDEAVENNSRAIFHCWNGIHATGYVAAAALNRYCGFSGAEAADYFVDGVPKGSLSQDRINSLANKLRTLPKSHSTMSGCP
jgi:predicted alpha/beta hydrolase